MKKLFIIVIFIIIPCLASAGIIEVIARQRVAGAGASIETLRPDGNTSTANWTASSVGFYQDTSDETDSTYVYTSNQNARIILTAANTSASAGKTINSVTIKCRVRDTAGSTAPDLYINPGSVFTYTLTGITGSFAEYEQILTVNPHTTNAWTSSEINSTFIGFDTANATNTTELAELWIEVDYVP